MHVNRSPITGVIADVTYQRGKFLVASRGIASAENEQNIITIRADDGTVVVVKQIAGLIARRIVCTKSVGDSVKAGERVGLIKFGSRVDVIFGPEWRVEVSPGSRVSAGSSVLARRGGNVELALPLAAGIKEALSADMSQPAHGAPGSTEEAAARGLCAAYAVYGRQYFSGLSLDHQLDSRRDDVSPRTPAWRRRILKSQRRPSDSRRGRTGWTAVSRG